MKEEPNLKEKKDYITSVYGPNQTIKSKEIILGIQNNCIVKPTEKQEPMFGINKEMKQCQAICQNYQDYECGSVVLLAGLPGTGKSMMMKNIAQRNANLTFFYCTVCDLMNRYDSGGENVRILFDMAKFYFPSVLILNEFESAGLEGWWQKMRSSIFEELKTFKAEKVKIPVFILNNELEGMVDKVPPICKAICMPFPDVQARIGLLKQMTANSNFREGIEFQTLATQLQGCTSSEIGMLIRDACYQPIRRLMKDNNGDFSMLENIDRNDQRIFATNQDIFDVLPSIRPAFTREQAQQFQKNCLRFQTLKK